MTGERSAPESGISLARLLGVARLTPAQAIALGADVFAELDGPPTAGSTRGRLRQRAVHIAPDGRARLIDDAPAAGSVPDADHLAAAATLLGDLEAAARPPASTAGPAAADPLAALGRAASEARRTNGSLATVASILRDADATGGTEARAELARLVSAASGCPTTTAPAAGTTAGTTTAGSAPRDTDLTGTAITSGTATADAPAADRPDDDSPAGDDPAGPEPTRSTPRGSRFGRHRRRPRAVAHAVAVRSWKWVLSFVVLVAVILVEIAFLRDDIERDIQAVLEAGRSGSEEIADEPPALPPVVPPAPAAMGAIAAVDVRAVEPCTQDAACAVRTQVVLQPHTEPQTVAWSFRILDRCTGSATTVPGGTVTVPPDANRTDAVGTVTLPPGEALAVLALTSRPAIAASAPLYVPIEGTCTTHPGELSG